MSFAALPTAPRGVAVDISYMGDWEEFQIAFGLLGERVTPQPDHFRLAYPEVAGQFDQIIKHIKPRHLL